jgi:hypothetical protein
VLPGARCPSPLTLGLDFRGCVSATRSETGVGVGSSSRSAELSPPVRPTCCRPLKSLSTRSFGVTIGATAIAGPWSALYVKLPTVLAALIRRVDRGSGGSRRPLRISHSRRQIEIVGGLATCSIVPILHA